MNQDNATEFELTSHTFHDLLEVLAETILQEFHQHDERERFLLALQNGLQRRVYTQDKCHEMGVTHLERTYGCLIAQISERS